MNDLKKNTDCTKQCLPNLKSSLNIERKMWSAIHKEMNTLNITNNNKDEKIEEKSIPEIIQQYEAKLNQFAKALSDVKLESLAEKEEGLYKTKIAQHLQQISSLCSSELSSLKETASKLQNLKEEVENFGLEEKPEDTGKNSKWMGDYKGIEAESSDDSEECTFWDAMDELR